MISERAFVIKSLQIIRLRVTYWIDWGQVNRSVEVRVETLNPGTLTGKGRERWICDMMER